MLNLFKKTKSVVREIKHSLEPKRDSREVIAEIHSDFDKITESLLNEARQIVSVDASKGERLSKLGFTNCDAVKIHEVKSWMKKRLETILYFEMHYPGYKYITLDAAADICKKHGLVMADCSFFKGDIPEKNISDIERFRLREEDKQECFCVDEHYGSGSHSYGYYKPRKLGMDYFRSDFVKVKDESIKSVFEQPSFVICATKDEFDTKYMKIEDGYKLVLDLPDPIVLQPVKDGYLIVTKWGIEDDALINEKMN